MGWLSLVYVTKNDDVREIWSLIAQERDYLQPIM